MANEMNDNPKVYLVAGLFNFIRKHWGMLEKLQTFLENNEDFDLKNTCSQLCLEYSAKLGEFSKYRTNDCVEELDAFFSKSAELMQVTVDKKEEVAVNEVEEAPKEEVVAEAEVEAAETVVEEPQTESVIVSEEADKEEEIAPVVAETETVVEAPQAEAVAVAETTNSQVEAGTETAAPEVSQTEAVAVAEVPKAEPVIAPEVEVPQVASVNEVVTEIPKEEAVTEVVATTSQAVETAPAPVAGIPQTEQVNVPVVAPVNIFQGTGVEAQPPLTPTNIPVQQSSSEGVIGNIPIIQGEAKENETSVAVSATSEGGNVLHVHSDGAKGRALLVTDKQKGNLSDNGKAVVLPFPTSTEVVAGNTVVDNTAQNSGEISSVEALTAQAVALNKAGNTDKAEEIMEKVHKLLNGSQQQDESKVFVKTAA